MKLLKFEGYQVVIEPEILSLKPFKKIWERDNSVDKNKAKDDISFIYFFADPRSDYSIHIDEKLRIEEIKKGIGFSSKWTPDKTILEAIELYKTFKPLAALLLDDVKIGINKLRSFITNTDLEDEDAKIVDKYTGALLKMLDLTKKVKEIESEINTEMVANSKMRGKGEKTIFEDGL